MTAHIKYTEDDVRGKQFGRLTGIAIYKRPRTNTENHYDRYAVCVCNCGKTMSAHLGSLMKGKYKSCGCLRTERITALSGNKWKQQENKEIK
ncbi:hypothetical protein [Klebsiella quasivariicola]|uniref:hypothetical protein n=1 Tax=Klebsiella quasivariicola TaxID=2026240 RepID=UPI002478BC47|nr:hypothetical protein [Klebsiella quasivariicola]